jgi:hypothetical protein
MPLNIHLLLLKDTCHLSSVFQHRGNYQTKYKYNNHCSGEQQPPLPGFKFSFHIRYIIFSLFSSTIEVPVIPGKGPTHWELSKDSPCHAQLPCDNPNKPCPHQPESACKKGVRLLQIQYSASMATDAVVHNNL